MSRISTSGLLRLLLLQAVALAELSTAAGPADQVYHNGVIFTADARGTIATALAVRDGQIVYVGKERKLARYTNDAPTVVDLKGRFLMPGLIDGHMHPFEAGKMILKCNLNYESLTVPELQQRVQMFLDRSATNEPNAWLEVVNWFQESMRPSGVRTSRELLDVLKTSRPVTGSLEVGKFADLIVLDRNPLQVRAEEIGETKIILTVLGGRTIYSKE